MTKAIKEKGFNLFSLTVIENGEEKTVSFQPVNPCNDIYSVSKAFIVTGIGLLYDDGLIDVEEKVVDIFADSLPDEYDERWNRYKSITNKSSMERRYI